jgi:hypothetical protein
MSLIFLVISVLCFGGILLFGKNMDALEVQRFLAGGLAAFAAAHIAWPANWGPGGSS